jgi:hypothetical protein
VKVGETELMEEMEKDFGTQPEVREDQQINGAQN